MKTFKNYLLDFIKIISFGCALAWLVSCDQTAERIRLIQQYEDSVGIIKLRIAYIDQQRDSIRQAYEQNYPPRAFDNKDTGARYAYRRAENNAYRGMLRDQVTFDQRYEPVKFQYFQSLNHYKRAIDSLKLTLK